MAKKWVGKKKTINFSQQEVDALEAFCAKTERTETEVIREGLRRFLKEQGALQE